MSKFMSNNHREVLYAQSSISGQSEYLTSTNHVLNSTATISGSPIPATGATSAVDVQIVDGSGNQITSFGSAPSDQAIASLTISAQDVSSTTTTGANNQPITTGTPTANSAASFTMSSRETVLVMVSGSWSGALVSEGSFDGGTTWVSKAIKQIGTSYTTNNLTGNFAGAVNVTGLTNYRIRANVAGTGSSTVGVVRSSNLHSTYVANNLALRDGVVQSITNTIKAASTPAVAADTAMVVALSPNTNLASGLPIINGEQTDFTGTFTNATQTGTVVATNLDGYGNVLISINGTYGTATAIFEGSDDSGTTWYTVQASRDNTNVIETGYTALTNTSQTWQINNPGLDSIRVRSTAVASGTVNVRMSASAAPGAAGANVAIGTALPTGSNTIGAVNVTDNTNNLNILKSDGTAAGQNAALIGNAYQSNTFSVTSVSNGTTYDAGGYKSVSIQVTSQYVGSTPTINFQSSNDGTNWFNNALYFSGAGAVANSTTGTGIYSGPLAGRYFRLTFSGTYSSGTAAGLIVFSTLPNGTLDLSVFQSGTWTVGSNSAAGSTTPTNIFAIGANNNSGNLTSISNAVRALSADVSGTGLAVSNTVYNGSSWDINRSATAASNTTGTGLLGVGNLMLGGSSTWQAIKSLTQAGDNGGPDSYVANGLGMYNGATVNFMRNNTTAAIIAAGATTTQTSATQTSYNASKLAVVINISAFTSGTLTFTVNGITSTGYTYPILVSSALGATGVTPLRIFPGATPSANAVANDMVPRSYNVVVTGTFSATYGVDYELSV